MADGVRVAARRARLLLHAHRPDRPLPADARPGGLLPDGLGRQRPAHRAAGAELLRRALRPVAALRPRLHAAGEARRRSARCRSAGRNFVELCERLVDEDEQVFEALWRTLGPLGRLDADTTPTIGAQSPGRVAAGVPAQPRPRRGLPARRRRRCGTSPSRPRSPRPSSRPASTPAPTTGSPSTGPTASAGLHRDHPARADPRVRGADRAPRRRALPAAVRDDRDARRSSASRSRCSPTTLAEPDKGAGIAMCCTFGDLTDVQWWRELQLPVAHRDRPRRPAAPRDRRSGSAPSRRRRRTPSSPARPRSRAREAMVGAAARVRRPRRRADADPADGELLREGRQAARDRLDPAVVHPQRRPRRRAARRAARARRRDRLGAGATCSTATTTGSTASTATG